jgi:hypothetical protein
MELRCRGDGVHYGGNSDGDEWCGGEGETWGVVCHRGIGVGVCGSYRVGGAWEAGLEGMEEVHDRSKTQRIRLCKEEVFICYTPVHQP